MVKHFPHLSQCLWFHSFFSRKMSEIWIAFTFFEKWKVNFFPFNSFREMKSEMILGFTLFKKWNWNLFLKKWWSIFFVSWPTTKLAFTFPIFKNLTEHIFCWLTFDKIDLRSPYFQKIYGVFMLADLQQNCPLLSLFSKIWVDSMLTDLRQNWPLLSLFSKIWRSRFYVDWPTTKLAFALLISKNLTE